MMTEILITNGGPHPPDKWAALATNRIVALIQVDEQSNSQEAVAARKAKPRFAIDLAEAVEPYFDNAMSEQRLNVEAGLIKDRYEPFSVGKHVDDAVSAIFDAAANTPFADHFSKDDVQDFIRNALTQYFLDAANIQRQWSFDAKGL